MGTPRKWSVTVNYSQLLLPPRPSMLSSVYILFSHLRRCRLPSLPLSVASRRFWLSRAEVGRGGGVTALVFARGSIDTFLVFMSSSSSGIDRGCCSLLAGTGDTANDSIAETAHASMSMVLPCWAGGGLVADVCARGDCVVAFVGAVGTGWLAWSWAVAVVVPSRGTGAPPRPGGGGTAL